MPRAMTTRQCQRLQGSRSSRDGIRVWMSIVSRVSVPQSSELCLRDRPGTPFSLKVIAWPGGVSPCIRDGDHFRPSQRPTSRVGSALRRSLRLRDADPRARRADDGDARDRVEDTFKAELATLLANYVGRPTPLTEASAARARDRSRGQDARAPLPEARGPLSHGRAQDQQRARPGAPREEDGQDAHHRRDRRRSARRRDRDGVRALRPSVRGLHGRGGRRSARRRTSAA